MGEKTLCQLIADMPCDDPWDDAAVCELEKQLAELEAWYDFLLLEPSGGIVIKSWLIEVPDFASNRRSAGMVAPEPPEIPHPEKFVRRVQKVTEEGNEVEVDEDWEFMTEEEMQDKGWSEERINGVKEHCKKNKGYIRKSLYDDEVLYWCNVKVRGKKKNFKRSFVRKVLEYEEEAAGKDDNEINMDFEFGAGAGGVAEQLEIKQPTAEIDPKLLSCFPEIEKAANPCGIYSKAGVAVEKRVKKLRDYKDELAMDAKIDDFIDRLQAADTELTNLYDSGIIDGYSVELLA
ncbi:hypothetical protein AK812_SmicGene10626 [Symbiodinium microadriaticum]|uniref:Uncharacterized protein n=1 Tax=Symbiodinium microadriaticum TaxID=2951 RepID=A0A1Q9EFB1_SYMMI|nr:hypothetical protein AK812_SmicGene10626 [Symbiodinium microadriaticum]CAE7692492.1 unnamed protein product [Symbiodinium sp. KB8]